MKKSALIALMLVLTALIPVATFAATQGPTSCNKNTASPSSAGSQVPLGGPYVPVADYAVELNTGLIVYKECVLREIITTQRKALLVKIDNQVLTSFNTNQGGNPTFGGFPSRELGKEEVALSIRTIVRYLDNDSLTGFNDAVEGKVKNAIGIGYTNARDPRKSFACPYTGDLEAAYRGLPTGSYWDAYNALSRYPGCSVLRAAEVGTIAVADQDAYELYKNRSRLEWGNGIYDLAHFDEDGFRVTDTPGQIVYASAENSVLSGYRQEQEADDINETVDDLWAGVTNQVLSPGSASTGGTNGGGSPGGLAAITQALSGATSYFGQLVQSAGGQVIQQGTDTASGLLASARKIEQDFHDAIQANIDVFGKGGTDLVNTEKSCYNKIAAAVCQGGAPSGSSCTATNGATLSIQMKNKFSHDAGGPLLDGANQLDPQLNDPTNGSNKKLSQIDNLIQRLAANQVTAAAAQSELTNTIKPHNATDVATAQGLKASYQSQVSGIVEPAKTQWNSTWCNTSDQSVLSTWISCWSGNSSVCPDN